MSGAHSIAHLRLEEGEWQKGTQTAGGVSNVDIDGNNALQIKVIGVVISTFETLPTSASRPTRRWPRRSLRNGKPNERSIRMSPCGRRVPASWHRPGNATRRS